MRFGTYVEFQCPDDRSESDVINDVIRAAEHTDRNGYSVFCTLEHPFYRQFAVNTNPLCLYGRLSERTRHLRFRTLCHTLPLHNPMILAGEIAYADIVTGGRLECGIGRGHAWLQEFANVAFEENLERFYEAADILVKAWTEEWFSFHGKYYNVDDISIVPKPIQKPHPPIFQVGSSAKTFVNAGRKGWKAVLGGPAPISLFVDAYNTYVKASIEGGHEPHVGYLKAVYLADDAATARREAEKWILRFIEYNTSPLVAGPRTRCRPISGWAR